MKNKTISRLLALVASVSLGFTALGQTVQNSGFETPSGTSTGAANWEGVGSGGAIGTPYYLQNSDAFAGTNCLVIEGQGNGVGAGPLVYQDLVTPVLPGTLTLSFQAKAPIKDGGANPQYQISWRNAANAEIGVSGFASFPSALNTSTYTSQAISGLTAPANSDHCTIKLLLAVGAGAGDHWKVQIDSVALVQNTTNAPAGINYPTNAAPNPTNSAASVLSMYNSSSNYTDHAGIGWYAGWSGNPGGNGDYTITNTSRIVKKYLGLNYAGVEFYNPNQINTAGYNTLHVDIWTPDANQFGIQLVSLAPTQAGQVNRSAITSNNWVGLNIPLSQFTDANGSLVLTNLEQLLWLDNGSVGGGVQNGNFYIDNVYFWSNAVAGPVVPNYPTNAAPNPTNSAASVVSLYTSSSNYTAVNIDTWLTGWSAANYADYTITNASRVVKRYSSLNYAGVEFFNPKINASAMNTFHVDLWTPNANKFSVKLVSFSPGGQEYEVVFTNNVIVTNTWVSLDIPVSTFTGGNPAMDFANLGQLLFINNNPGGPQFGTFFIDNVYFCSNAVAGPVVPNYPTNAAPNPTQSATNVVSLYTSSSNYTAVNIDTWLTGWSAANYADYTITNASRVVKRYSSLNYAGVEFFNPKINASAMNTFHVDLWTPNANKFSVKLVSFSPGGQEYEVVFTNNVIVTNTWVSLNIPVSTFTGGNPAMDFANLGQLLFINNNPGGPQLGTFFIDNVYFFATATPPTIVTPAVGGGNFTAQSASQTGFNYILQATPVLAPATWTGVQTNAGTGATLNFSVPVSPGNPQRFFRIKVQ